MYTVYTYTHSAVFGFPLYIFCKKNSKESPQRWCIGVKIVVYIEMYFCKHGGKFTL